MGGLIDKYGLWGTGETLLVADREEGWVLEMQPTPTGKGGFWIAQRVPDGEFFVAANQFRIHAIKPGNPDQIFNPQLPDMLKKAGWAAYDKKGNLDWVRSMKAEAPGEGKELGYRSLSFLRSSRSSADPGGDHGPASRRVRRNGL